MNKSISVIIPTKNEEIYISRCLISIIENDYSTKNIEIIVSDGLSTDRTRTIVKDFQKKHSNIKLIDNPAQYTPHGLNRGVESAKGEFIMILGAHSKISRNYISSNIRVLEENSDIGASGGKIVNAFENQASEAISKAMSSKFGVGNAKFRTQDYQGYVDTAAFAVYREEVFDRIGMFDENLVRNQDAEFNYRLRQAGYKIYLTSDCYAKYYVRSSFKELFIQYYQYGFWKIHFNFIHQKITSLRQVFPMLFIIIILLTLISWTFFMPLFQITLGFVILHFILALYFSFRKSNKLHKIFLVFKSFYTLHISYGLGYLFGILKAIFKKY
jgi:GT2 family glycosyltransferase